MLLDILYYETMDDVLPLLVCPMSSSEREIVLPR